MIHNDEKGNGTVVNTLRQLDYFGEMGLLNKGESHNADVVASTDCELLEHDE